MPRTEKHQEAAMENVLLRDRNVTKPTKRSKNGCFLREEEMSEDMSEKYVDSFQTMSIYNFQK